MPTTVAPPSNPTYGQIKDSGYSNLSEWKEKTSNNSSSGSSSSSSKGSSSGSSSGSNKNNSSQPNWNNVTYGQIQSSGYSNLSEWKVAYAQGRAQAPTATTTTPTTKSSSVSFIPGATVRYNGVMTSAQTALIEIAKEYQSKKISSDEYNKRVADISRQSNLPGSTSIRQPEINHFYNQVSPPVVSVTGVGLDTKKRASVGFVQRQADEVAANKTNPNKYYTTADASTVEYGKRLIEQDKRLEEIAKTRPLEHSDIAWSQAIAKGENPVIYNIESGLSKTQMDYEEKYKGDLVAGFTTGFGVGVVGGGLRYIKNPITALGQDIKSMTIDLPNTIVGVAYSLKNDVSYTLGTMAGNILVSKKVYGGLGKAANFVADEVSVLGKSKGYIPSEKVVVPEVTKKLLEGKTAFPEAKGAADALKKYYTEDYKSATGKNVVYSASDYFFTPFKGRNIIVEPGRGLSKKVDVPVMYASTRGISAHFLRIYEGLTSKYKLLPEGWRDLLPSKPKVMTVAEVPKRIPKEFRTDLATQQSFFGKTPETIAMAKTGVKPAVINARVGELAVGKKGTPYFTPALELGLKSEAEVGIITGTALKRVGMNTAWDKLTGFSKYTRINGRVVPFYEMEVVGKGVGKGLIEKVSTSDYSKYSSGVTKSSLINPKSVSSLSSIANVAAKIYSSKSLNVNKPISSYSPSVSSSISSKAVSFIYPKVPSYSSKSNTSYSINKLTSSGKTSSSYSKGGSSYRLPRVSSGVSNVSSLSSGVPSVVSSYGKINSYNKMISSYSSPKYKSNYFSSGSSYNFPRVPPLTPPKIPKDYYQDYSKKQLPRVSQGYSVSTRIEGKEYLLAVGVPKNLAVKIGTTYTDRTSARSIKIKPVGVTRMRDVAPVNVKKYRVPKPNRKVAREGFQLVEKAKFAIDTPGEFSEITLKGLSTKKSRVKKKKK